MTPDQPLAAGDTPTDLAALEADAPDDAIEISTDDVSVETAAGLAPSALEWIADAALVVHAIEEYCVVPWAPNADEMWELGKLTSERLGLLLKVHRAGRRYGLNLESRQGLADRPFTLGGLKAKSWHDVIVFEAVVGPFFRVFYESFFRSAVPEIHTLARELWEETQGFIRFGQARMARALAAGERPEIEAAVETWLPAAVQALGEVPADVDESWHACGLRPRTSRDVRQDFLDEIATYLQGNDLEIPAAARDAVQEVEVKWLGAEVAGGGRRDRPLKSATFAFTDRLRGDRGDPSPSTSDPAGGSE